MNDRNILLQPRLPARLTMRESAAILGFQEHDMPVVIRATRLKPLGNPPPNGTKYFWASEILALSQDREFLNKATKAVTEYWRKKNERRSVAR